MIVLDTNILSASMRRASDAAVIAWLDAQPVESIWTSAITVFEIRFGIEILASGHRRRELEDAFDKAVDEDLGGRVCLSINRLPGPRPRLPLPNAARDTRSKFAMSKSPALSPRVRRRLPPATSVTSKERGLG